MKCIKPRVVGIWVSNRDNRRGEQKIIAFLFSLLRILTEPRSKIFSLPFPAPFCLKIIAAFS